MGQLQTFMAENFSSEIILGFLKDNLSVAITIFAKFLVVICILAITVVINKIMKKILNAYFTKASAKLHIDQTQFSFFRHLISAVIYLIGIGLAIFSVPQLRTLSVSLFAGAGILALVIGFASQEAFANIVSGIMITIFKPFHVGDRIKIGKEMRGIVEDITLRHTVIKDFENKRIIVPNSVMGSEVIENSTIEDSKIVKWVDFSISYDANIDKALKIMQKEAEKHPKTLDNRTEEAKKNKKNIVNTKVIGFADSSVLLRAYIWTENPASAFILGTDLNRAIKLRFDKEGIEIPFPYRTIVYKKDMKVRKTPAKKKTHNSSKKQSKKIGNTKRKKKSLTTNYQ